MIAFNQENFTIYFLIAWGSNIALNLLYVIKRYIPSVSYLDYPLDFKIKIKNQRVFGDSVTIPGLVVCSLISLLIYFYSKTTIWSWIPLLVFAGDTIGSFIKRRFHKKRGEFMLFVDHGDYMIVTGIVLVSLHYISYQFALFGVILTYILHPIVCYLAFKLKLREYPY